VTRYRITTPVTDYSGSLGGLVFNNGEALAGEEHTAELAYARARGYGVEELADRPVAPELPKKSASTETWRAYAVAAGEMSEAEAGLMSRDELVEYFITEEKPS